MEKANNYQITNQLTDKDISLLREIRIEFSQELERYPECNTQWYLLRFCVARKHNKKKVFKMLKNFFEFRDKKDFNRIRQIQNIRFNSILDHVTRGLYGVDKLGRPIIVARPGKSDPEKVVRMNSIEFFQDFLIQSFERTLHIQFPILSGIKGERVDKTLMIADLSGLKLSVAFDSKFKKMAKNISSVGQDLYPEVLGKVIIVNAPKFIKAIWSLVSMWIDSKTTAKIDVYTDAPLKVLTKYVDIEQLPTFLGGKCEREVNDNHGPWEGAIKDSFDRNSFFMRDRSLEYQYFYTEEERQNALGRR